MGEKRGMKALEAWCKKVTDGYRGVKIDNMTTCWRDGLAFCAIIHHFRPDLIDFDNLEKNDIYHNNELAFRTAEHHLGIPALLDAEDMVEYEVPDRLSILTYLSQFYQTFTGSQQGSSPTRVLSKRPVSSTEQGVLSPVSESPPSKVAARLGRREPCAKCGLPVFIAERLLVNGRTLYHRTCFRCARCQHQLSLANFYETEGGEYCCETCPDEVLDSSNLEDKPQVASQSEQNNLDMIGHAGPRDEYSAEFELALEKLRVPHVSEVQEQAEWKNCKARSDFMSSQLNISELQDAEELSSIGDKEKQLPEPEQQAIDNNKQDVCSSVSQHSALEGQIVDRASYSALNTGSLNNVYKLQDQVNSKSSSVNIDSTPACDSEHNLVAKNISTESVISGTVGDSLFLDSSVPAKVSSNNSNCVDDGNQLEAKIDNVAPKGVHDKELNSSGEVSSSIVKMRRKLFENTGNTEENTKATKTRSNNKSALYQKDETNSPPLGSLITRVEPVEPPSKNLLVETNKVDVLENQDGQEKSVGELDMSKEKNKSETCENREIVGSPLKDDSQPHIGDSVGCIDNEDRMANMTVSGVSDMQESGKDGVPKDASSIKIMEVGDIQSSLAPPKSTAAMKNDDQTYPIDLNPFGDDDDDETEQTKLSERRMAQEMNPFGSTDDEAEMQIMVEPPTPPVPVTRDRRKKVVEAPKINLNPFWSDGEEPSSGDENADTLQCKAEKIPVPRPRTVMSVTPEPRPVPRKSLMTNSSDMFGSASSLSSLSSAGGTSSRKKKKPAPAPPRAQDLFPETCTAPSDNSSEASSPCPSLGYPLSPVATSRHRKSRPAPLPPIAKQGTAALSFSEARLVVEKLENSAFHTSEWEREKNKKDVTNRNRQSQTSNTVSFEDPMSPGEQQLMLGPNKSTYGQWKRKKGPAPPRPVPQRRQTRAIPMKEVKRELDDIEVQQQELERQGVTLEKSIRDKFDQAPNADDDSSMTPDVEDLVLQLFELVNEKNELFRRQAELMYLRRQQRLEEEHADLEYQIRCLMDVPEHTKTDSDKAREEELIQRLVEVVERRNEIVECLEMDRIREAEEDRSIRSRLGMFSKGKILCQEEGNLSNCYSGKLKKKKRDKEKQSNKKAVKSEIDVDKDVDEGEESLPKHTKEKKSKRKWF